MASADRPLRRRQMPFADASQPYSALHCCTIYECTHSVDAESLVRLPRQIIRPQIDRDRREAQDDADPEGWRVMDRFRGLGFHRTCAHNSPQRRLARGDCALNRCPMMQACITPRQCSATTRFAFDCARALRCGVRGWAAKDNDDD
jgi:hypothetical protein